MMQTTSSSNPSNNNIETLKDAENALHFLAKEHFFENKVTVMNISSLKQRFESSDVYPVVKIHLIRDIDRKNAERCHLAQIISGTMQTFLSETFSGSSKTSQFVLRVNVSVVSDGSNPRWDRIANILGRGKEQDRGLAKLAVSYCLAHRTTGDVVAAKQFCRWENYHLDRQRSKLVVLDMAAELHRKISREVKFLCSCGGGDMSSKDSEASKKRMITVGSNNNNNNNNKSSTEPFFCRKNSEWSNDNKQNRFRIPPYKNKSEEEDLNLSSTSIINEDDDDSICSFAES